MSMVAELLDMDDLDERDREVLRVLADGRANPKLIREETGLDKGDVNTVLVRLGRGGLVRQRVRGLYEITDEGLEEIGEPADVDLTELRDALADVREAYEAVDGDDLGDALSRAEDVLEGGGGDGS